MRSVQKSWSTSTINISKITSSKNYKFRERRLISQVDISAAVCAFCVQCRALQKRLSIREKEKERMQEDLTTSNRSVAQLKVCFIVIARALKLIDILVRIYPESTWTVFPNIIPWPRIWTAGEWQRVLVLPTPSKIVRLVLPPELVDALWSSARMPTSQTIDRGFKSRRTSWLYLWAWVCSIGCSGYDVIYGRPN